MDKENKPAEGRQKKRFHDLEAGCCCLRTGLNKKM